MVRRPSEPRAEPPKGVAWTIPVVEILVDSVLLRMTRTRHANPLYFGRSGTSRFDAPDAEYGVCYFGTSLACCFLEVFSAAIRRGLQHHVLSVAHVREYRAVIATSLRPLRLANLADDGLALLGIDQRVTGGNDYDLSQRWSAAIHEHPGQVDGLYYPSRHHNGLYSVALSERAQAAVRVDEWGQIGDPGCPDLWVELNQLLKRFQVDLLDES